MRITFVLGYASMAGGVRIIATLADLLRKRGHSVTVVSLPKADPSLRDRARHIVRHRRWIREPAPGPSFLDFVDVDHRVLDRWRPVTDRDLPDADVVIATWWETAQWVASLSACKGAKAYFVQHYEVAMPNQPNALVDASYRLPLHIITTCRWLERLMRERFGVKHLSVVPYSVDTSLFNAPPRGKQPRPTVGFMYSQIPFKGCDTTIEAIRLARESVPELEVVAFGSDEPSNALPLPRGARFTRCPKQESLREHYAACDAWLFGSRCEGFGMPIMEAMACRTPVIGTPTGAAPELLGNGEGILVRACDSPALIAHAIVTLVRMSAETWRQMSDRAYDRVTGYTWNDAAASFLNALESTRRHASAHPIA